MRVTKPVVAPVGTLVVRLVGVEAVTGAPVPLKATWLSPGVALKPLPKSCTSVPDFPLLGLTSVMETEALGSVVKRLIWRMLPTAS